MVPVWRITPGSAITDAICATPPITQAAPSTRASVSVLSTPFCNVSTPVPGPISGRLAAAAASVS